MQIEPKKEYIEETKSLTQKSRDMHSPELVSVCGMELVVFPEVFNPEQFFSSCWFAKELSRFLQTSCAAYFCEIGSGTGIVSLYAAKHNPELKITSCDINQNAVANTRENLQRHNISSLHVEVLESDVFSGLGEKKFDVIFWALPFGYEVEGTRLDNVDLQTFDAGYKAIEEFFRSGAGYLNQNGQLLFGFSPELGHFELIEKFADEYGWILHLVSEHEGTEKSIVRMQLYSAELK